MFLALLLNTKSVQGAANSWTLFRRLSSNVSCASPLILSDENTNFLTSGKEGDPYCRSSQEAQGAQDPNNIGGSSRTRAGLKDAANMSSTLQKVDAGEVIAPKTVK